MVIGSWILAIRPKTLSVGLAPVLLGCALAWRAGSFDVVMALGCVGTALFLQIGSNLANDYFDHLSKVDTAERLGPIRVTQAGLLPPYQVRLAFIAALALGSLAGLYCAYRTGWELLALGVVCVLSALLYTAGPYPLSHLGLGEAFAFVFFGPVACTGTYFALTRTVPLTAVLAGCIPGFHAAAVLGINNLRDIATDTKAGKRTLAVRCGETFARWETALLVLAGNALPLALFAVSGHWPLLAALVLLIPAWRLGRHLRQQPISREFNRYLAAAAQLDLATAVLVAILWCVP